MKSSDMTILGVIILIISGIAFASAQSTINEYETGWGHLARALSDEAREEYDNAQALRAFSIIGGIIGIGLLLAGITSKSSKDKKPYSYPHQQSAPPMATEVHTCNYCKNYLRFIQQYQKWYCDTCRRYL